MDLFFKVVGVVICLLSFYAFTLSNPYSELAPIFVIIIVALGCIIFGIGHLIGILEKQSKK